MKNSDTGAGALIDLVTAGIVDKGGAFGPDKQLDRELMIHWIMNALDYKTGGSYPIPMVKPGAVLRTTPRSQTLIVEKCIPPSF